MIREVPGRRPRIDPDEYVDPQAAVTGNVTIAAGASVCPSRCCGATRTTT